MKKIVNSLRPVWLIMLWFGFSLTVSGGNSRQVIPKNSEAVFLFGIQSLWQKAVQDDSIRTLIVRGTTNLLFKTGDAGKATRWLDNGIDYESTVALFETGYSDYGTFYCLAADLKDAGKLEPAIKD